MDDHHVERRRLARPGLDHPLELGSAIIGGGCAGFDESIDQLQTTRQAIGFALPALIGNGDVMLGLPRSRNAQIEGGARRHVMAADSLHHWHGPNRSSKTSTSACLTGTRSGQLSVTVHVERSSLGGRPTNGHG